MSWGKILCLTHPTPLLTWTFVALYTTLEGHLQKWHYRGLDGELSERPRTSPPLPNCNILITVYWIVIQFGADIHGPQRMNPNDLIVL